MKSYILIILIRKNSTCLCTLSHKAANYMDFSLNKRPVLYQDSEVCFLNSPRFIVYEHDSYVGCTLRQFQQRS